LGVTIIIDVMVVSLFSFCVSVSGALLSGTKVDPSFAGIIALDMLFSLVLGFMAWGVLRFIFEFDVSVKLQGLWVILAGYFIFSGCTPLGHFIGDKISVPIHPEPLLICMIGTFLFTNRSDKRSHLQEVLHEIHTPIYIAFFTLTGMTLHIGILKHVWMITLILFFVRLLSIFIGSWLGGRVAREPSKYYTKSWMAYITQAGVGLGLCKAVSVQFPSWGPQLATVIISVIVINEILGPIMYKWVLFIVGEGRNPALKSDHDTIHNCVIFGGEGQAHALAKQLHTHDWHVVLACRMTQNRKNLLNTEVEIHPFFELCKKEMEEVGCGNAGAIVTLYSDADNLKICELAYKHFPRANLIVYLNERANYQRFHDLGAFVVSPSTAIVCLLDHYVRSPSAVSLLLGMEQDHDVIDVEMRNPALVGLTLRELRMPEDIIVLSIHRIKNTLNVHGYVRFKYGDWLTVAGSEDSLREVELLFDEG
jgi:Trk K+ transport system NAD-binding subunit